MQIDTRKLKKVILKALPYAIFAYAGNLIGYAYRTAEGSGFQEKILPFMSNLGTAFAKVFPSLHPPDILFGLVLAGVMRLVLYIKSKNKKKFRQGEEYGSAVWGTEKDIEPYMDLSDPDNNVILTKTESLTMGKPSAPKFARNKNIHMGAGLKSRVRELFTKLLIAEASVGAAALLIVELFPAQLIGIFGAANESSYYTGFAIKAFRIYLCMIIFACVNKSCFFFLQAMGKAVESTALSVIREIVFGVGLAILLPVFFGLDGVLYSMPVADILTFMASLFLIVRTYREIGEKAENRSENIALQAETR